jgi:hypothetical protein
MPIEGIHPYYLRTSDTTEGTGYPTLDTARAALRFLITRQQGLGNTATEQRDGRWLIQQRPTGSITIWLEDEGGVTVRLT